MNRTPLTITILLLSMLTIMAAAAVAPMLGILSEHFSTESDLAVRMILTLPQIIIIPSSLLVGRLSRRYAKRHLLIIGLLFYIIGGLSGGLSESITSLLIFRGILGFGIGFIFPITTSLVSDYYSGEQRIRMMGLSTAVNNLGGVIATLLSGLLALSSWRHPFLIYVLAIIVLFCVLVWIPRVDPVRPPAGSKCLPSWLSREIIRSLTGILMLNIIFYTIPSTTSMTIGVLALGGSLFCGSMLAIQNFCSFSAGVFFRRFFHVFGNHVRYVSMLLMGLGFLFFMINPTGGVLMFSLVCIGTGFGILTPFYLLQISNLTSGHARTAALSAASGSMFLGQFLNPVILSLFIRIVSPISTSAVLPSAASILLIIPTVAVMFIIDRTDRSGDHRTERKQG
jgi:predicted MFS family arabinose efflux permease